MHQVGANRTAKIVSWLV